MESLWNEHEEATYTKRCVEAGYPAELGARVYTSQLLGRRSDLVLHGGGNTSVKSRAREIAGRECDVLFVKGSGWDLATIEPAGFPACRLQALLELCDLEELSDTDMVKGLRSQMLDPGSPTPSVEALLHALIPGKFVDHTHADAAVAILDRPEGRDLAREVWGEESLILPYVMPGFILARSVHALRDQQGLPDAGCLILDKHGIFTWDGTARASYERMVEAVSRAERRLAVTRSRLPSTASLPLRSLGMRGPVAIALRGAIQREHSGSMVSTWAADEHTLALSTNPNGPSLTAGPITPDHVIRTKPWPLWLRAHDTKSLRSQCDTAVREYSTRYKAYFDRHVNGRPLKQLPSAPRVVLVPGLGACCFGTTLRDAEITADIFGHTAQVLLDVTTETVFEPVGESDLFELEYWSLEQAKLGKGALAPMQGRVALVTGAAGGIGLETAQAMLARGCHVFISDVDETALESATQALRDRFAERVAAYPCDVCSLNDVDALIERCISAFGGLDYVISNAGVAPTGVLHNPDGQRSLEASLRVNLMGHQHVASASARWLIEQGSGGCLVFNASKAAFAPGPEFGPYTVAKTALIGLMRQYAIDLGRLGIRANAVNADRVRTGLFGGGVLEQRAAARGLTADAYFRQNLLGRETEARDVAEAFVWLCSAEATTGTVITVDGGNPAAFPR
ncbi:MAG: bifunctional aldolase/short-chain dehydrogenase [Polyangiaceae bacterium]